MKDGKYTQDLSDNSKALIYVKYERGRTGQERWDMGRLSFCDILQIFSLHLGLQMAYEWCWNSIKFIIKASDLKDNQSSWGFSFTIFEL